MEILQETLSLSTSSISSSVDLYPMSIDSELWLMAEQRINEVLCVIQPVLASEEKRKGVVNYIQNKVKDTYATEVFLFGSLPYKTYLPDGDIDLTVLTHNALEEDLAQKVYNILKSEEEDSRFQVKDVQYVPAQVKIVKCTVKDISVDISFNQMAGLCALGFLEQVNQLIEKDHLFKRSVILIKAWCYYESRILGAHRGLFSTYALEILVLHIINLFHASLPGPLAVLHKFLDYYSVFDWDNYCVSIMGPVAISSLPDNVAGSQEFKENELLLCPEFLINCKETFSVPTDALENGNCKFHVKYMNIIDPLKYSNNLGRSISKGSCHRIKGALSFGAKKLAEILKLPGESMLSGLENFFINTLDRNGRGERADAEVPVPAFGTGRSEGCDLNENSGSYYLGLLHGQLYHQNQLSILPQLSPRVFPPQIHQNTADNLALGSSESSRTVCSCNSDAFMPGVPGEHCYTLLCATNTCGIEVLQKSRGTGTYIPDPNRYGDLLLWMKERRRKIPRCPPLKSGQNMNPSRYTTETQTSSNGDCLNHSLNHQMPETELRKTDVTIDFSLDQFPVLPRSKQSKLSDTDQSCQPTEKFQQDKVPPLFLEKLTFGTFKLPSSALVRCSSAAKVRRDSRISTTLTETQSCKLTDTRKDMFLRQHYQLKNEQDFPSLS